MIRKAELKCENCEICQSAATMEWNWKCFQLMLYVLYPMLVFFIQTHKGAPISLGLWLNSLEFPFFIIICPLLFLMTLSLLYCVDIFKLVFFFPLINFSWFICALWTESEWIVKKHISALKTVWDSSFFLSLPPPTTHAIYKTTLLCIVSNNSSFIL